MHEYTVIDHPKHKILFGIALVSGGISSLFSNHIQPWIQETFNAPVVATYSVSVLTIFYGLYFLFNLLVWKLPLFGNVFNFPNLDGEWECSGLSTNTRLKKQFDWKGTVTIKQNWDRILITLKTNNSTSSSLSTTGGIKYYAGMGYKLSYHYENNPSANSDDDLYKHEGYCILTFCDDGKTAEGCYFNNAKDRQSYGEMKLERKEVKKWRILTTLKGWITLKKEDKIAS
jgi:SMODS-associating 2TM, beta-strand rich effector domain